jgi:large subunit ribosomal protein L15
MTGLNSLTRTGERSKTRVGRGGSRGKTSGRGTKGQSSRAGNKKRPEWRDIIKKMPKLRGMGKNRGRTVVGTRLDAFPIALGHLATAFDNGAEVNALTLVEKGVVRLRGGKFPVVKIVSGGEFAKKLVVKGIPTTVSARAHIEKAGGSVA